MMSFAVAKQQEFLYEEKWVLSVSVSQCLKQVKSHH